MLALTPFDAPFTFDASDPTADGDRLRRSAEALLRSYRSITVVGAADDIADLLRDHGAGSTGWCSFDLLVNARRVALICVSMKIWRSTLAMRPFQKAKSLAGEYGANIVIVPEPFFKPTKGRFDDLDIDLGGLRSILELLLANGRATLIEVAARLRHPDPVNAVLNMVTAGLLDIDLDAPILPGSGVRFARGCGR